MAAAFTYLSTLTSAQTQADGRNLNLPQPGTIKELPVKIKRWALVIGVDQYGDGQISPLRGAVSDAHALDDALARYGGFPAD